MGSSAKDKIRSQALREVAQALAEAAGLDYENYTVEFDFIAGLTLTITLTLTLTLTLALTLTLHAGFGTQKQDWHQDGTFLMTGAILQLSMDQPGPDVLDYDGVWVLFTFLHVGGGGTQGAVGHT